jgi:hypothetical protein
MREALVIALCETFPRRNVDLVSVSRLYRVCRERGVVGQKWGSAGTFQASHRGAAARTHQIRRTKHKNLNAGCLLGLRAAAREGAFT